MKPYEKPKIHVISFQTYEVLIKKSGMIELPILPCSFSSESDTDERSDLGNPVN